MSAAQILAELERRGVSLEVAGDRLRFRPKEAITPELLEALRARKAEIVRVLGQSQVETPAPVSLEYVRRFGHPAAALYPLIGLRVRTTAGQTGTLLQVFAGRATVLLDSEVSKPQDRQRTVFFQPSEIACGGVM